MRASVPFRTAQLRPRANVRVQRRFASNSPSGINTEEAQKKAQEALASAGKRLGQAVEVGKKYLGPVGEKAGNMLGCEYLLSLIQPDMSSPTWGCHVPFGSQAILTLLHSLPGTSSLQLCRGPRVFEAGLHCGALAAPDIAIHATECVLHSMVACKQPRVLA